MNKEPIAVGYVVEADEIVTPGTMSGIPLNMAHLEENKDELLAKSMMESHKSSFSQLEKIIEWLRDENTNLKSEKVTSKTKLKAQKAKRKT